MLKIEPRGCACFFKSIGRAHLSLWESFHLALGLSRRILQAHTSSPFQSWPCVLLLHWENTHQTDTQHLPAVLPSVLSPPACQPSFQHCEHAASLHSRTLTAAPLNSQGQGPSRCPPSLSDHSQQLTKQSCHIICLHTHSPTHILSSPRIHLWFPPYFSLLLYSKTPRKSHLHPLAPILLSSLEPTPIKLSSPWKQDSKSTHYPISKSSGKFLAAFTRSTHNSLK